MNKSNNLKWRLKEAKISQNEFARRAGVSIGTVIRLCTDETTWDVMRDGTVDKVLKAMEELSGKPETEPVVVESEEVEEELIKVEDRENAPAWALEMERAYKDQLTSKDTKTMILIEFVYEGLTEAKTHSEFIANIKMLKRILKDC